MSQPTPYTPQADYSVDISPGDFGNALDVDFNDIALSIDEICENLALIQKDDGGIVNGLVTPFTLSADTVALLSDWDVRGAWVTATAYNELDLVTQSGISYLCLVAHVAGTFATDLAAGKWTAFSKADSLSSPFTLTLLDDTTGGAWLTTLGFSAFAKTLVDDASSGAFLTTLGLSANAQTFVTAVDYAAMRTALSVYSTTEAMPKAGGAFSGGITGTTLGLSGALTASAAAFAGALSAVGATFTGLLDLSTVTAGQIAFPAVQNASADHNTLDDYEEGTWTPALTFGGGSTGLTYNSRAGSYVKIGQMVVLQFSITLSAKGSSTGGAAVGGVPFAADSTVGAVGAINWASMTSSYVNMQGSLAASSITVAGITAANATMGQAQETGFSNNSIITGTITYRAAA